MVVFLLLLIPLTGGLFSFLIKKEPHARSWSFVISIIILVVSIYANLASTAADQLHFEAAWMGSLGSSFSLKMDGLSQILCLLTAVSYPVILLATWKTSYRKANNFFALMLLTQAGLMGVFISMDALLFYFFWELALIPAYFLCSGWGGEKRVAVTFKFFIYTFTGSILMLVGLLMLYFQTPDHSFSLASFYALRLGEGLQNKIFGLLFLALAIKMPIFPFHTWQPDTYEQAPTAVTMVLSAVMVKMGLYGILRWVLPIVPLASYAWGDVVSSLSIIGIIYASVIAIRQNDLKRLIAYSSIAHMGLMAAAIFAESQSALQGVMVQMFNHGINILGLWIGAELIERQFKTRQLSELGGIAQKAPALASLFIIIALAGISLPLTNSFVGEFMMFNGIWVSGVTKYHVVFAVCAAISIILAAVYTLTMIQKIFYGNTSPLTASTMEINGNEKTALGLLVVVILAFGIFPQPLLNLTKGFVDGLLKTINVLHT
ncbi:MAG: NADH-quinone oxidoreductase subunit M [Flavisolibacter sp.]